jgi:NAD(P)H-hydrate epimerase
MAKILKKRKRDTHKGDYGHVLIVAGSIGLTGAAYLTSEAALLSGSGLVTLAIPKSLNDIMEKKLTEVMTLPVKDGGRGYFPASGFEEIKKFSKNIDAAAIGPGIAKNGGTKKLVKKLIQNLNTAIVLDADGINCIAGEADVLKKSKKAVVITPHPGEMSRLVNKSVGHIQRNRKKIAEEISRKYGVTVVLKGAKTVVASQDGRTYVNKTGNPGMASGGVGDVLTGIIASLIGQGYKPFNAARFGVYLHGRAGDIAAKKSGETSLRAQDILDNIYKAIKHS